MKFCDKLSMQRKKNNMSQEVLADRLGVSRQAVSKWESGASMPDMERIMELCKILDCNLDDLVDDGVIGSGVKKEESKDNIINSYLKEGLSFVTKSLNMFWSMRFRDKVKCIIELLFIALVIYLLWSGVYFILTSIFSGLLQILPDIMYKIIHNVFRVIYSILGLAVGVILVIHVFKIRYLDYFVTVEDASVKEKSIEKPVDEVKNEDSVRQFTEKKKNKIIIRDPKHSTYGFFDFLASVAVFIIKGILAFISILGIFSFIFLVFSLTYSVIKIFSGTFYVGTSISILGAILVNYICLRVIITFIFNQKQKFKLSFIIFIIGLVLFGMGFGISFNSYLSFSEIEEISREYTTYTEEIEMKDNTILHFIENDNVEVIIDETRDNIKIEITYDTNGYINLRSHRSYTNSEDYYNIYSCYYYNNGNSFSENFNYLINRIDNKEKIDSDYDGIKGYKITINSNNLEVIKNNYKTIFD